MSSPLDRFKDKNVIFIGLGQGRSAAGVKAYLEKHAGIKSFEGVNGQKADDPWAFLKDYDQATTVFVKNEGVPGPLVPVPYISPMQLFFELLAETGATTVGITGTKGKSTTTSLTAAMLQASGKHVFLCGNIGTSVFEYLDQASQDSIFVIELSSYQLSDTTISPHISMCINLYFDHADWHGSLEQYWEAKHNIMRFAGPEDYFVYNPDFLSMQQWAKSAVCKTVTFSADEEIDMTGSKLLGAHNKLNAIAARAAARLAGASEDGIAQAIKDFQPLKHRLEVVANVEGITYIDDGIATTPEATLAALAAVTEEIGPVGCLMLGGEDRGYDFSELLRTVVELNISNLVLFPPSGERIREELPGSYHPTVCVTHDMQEAVKFAHENCVSGEAVLLSNASPSYSIWPEGFEQKGRLFQESVSNL